MQSLTAKAEQHRIRQRRRLREAEDFTGPLATSCREAVTDPRTPLRTTLIHSESLIGQRRPSAHPTLHCTEPDSVATERRICTAVPPSLGPLLGAICSTSTAPARGTKSPMAHIAQPRHRIVRAE